MQIQGGKYTWAVAFAIFGAAILYGQRFRKHVFDAWGCGLAGMSCFLVAAFYLIAPLLKDGFITLGMLPWFFPAFVAAFMAAVNATDRDW